MRVLGDLLRLASPGGFGVLVLATTTTPVAPAWVTLLGLIGIGIAMGGVIGTVVDLLSDDPSTGRLTRQQWGSMIGFGLATVVYAIALVAVYR